MNKKEYGGNLALQIMFITENKGDALGIAAMAREIEPDEIQINTPLRSCGARPLSREKIEEISRYFKGMNTISVYSATKKKVTPISRKETLRRRGKI